MVVAAVGIIAAIAAGYFNNRSTIRPTGKNKGLNSIELDGMRFFYLFPCPRILGPGSFYLWLVVGDALSRAVGYYVASCD